MNENESLKVLHLTTHLNIGGITKYCLWVGNRMSKDGHHMAILSAGGELQQKFIDSQITSWTLPIRYKSILSPGLWWHIPKIVSMVRQENYDILHAHTRVTQFLASFVSRFTGVPVVTTAHGFYKRNFGRKIFPAWGKRTIAISSMVAEELQKTHKVPSKNIRIIFNSIDFAEHRKSLESQNPSQLRRQLGLRESTFVVGCISRLVRDKGHDYLIEAVALLRKKYSDVAVLIVGEGREKKRLEQLVQKKSLDKVVHLLSAQADTMPYYAMMDAFVHPATYREGFGLSILEAMASKIPVVASDVWAINTIIRNRVNGFLVPPKDAAAIAQTLLEIIENPEFAGSLAHNAYENALENYNMDRMARELETVYREAIGSKR